MNAYLPICSIVLAVFGIAFGIPVAHEAETQSLVDTLYQISKEGKDIRPMLIKALNDTIMRTKLEHFQYIDYLATTDDPKRQLAKQLLMASKDKFTQLLQEIGYDGQITVNEYIDGLYELDTTGKVEDKDLEEKLRQIEQLEEQHTQQLETDKVPAQRQQQSDRDQDRFEDQTYDDLSQQDEDDKTFDNLQEQDEDDEE